MFELCNELFFPSHIKSQNSALCLTVNIAFDVGLDISSINGNFFIKEVLDHQKLPE
jgi:hypothetical protein